VRAQLARLRINNRELLLDTERVNVLFGVHHEAQICPKNEALSKSMTNRE
jgi:hypothetical protein